ncbi:hypothetical protein ACX27_02795 [Nostoc piscinale CENA21]|uniref:DUF2887 domain-containing protein n=1 Tax=Nostoc piscinale CENA21 TaxID=224013 RepID=A0A0M4SZR8_9NOSO|nr:hypothetical protein ACX27_02795 [Nostoc piscinale CENA21]
MRRDSIFYKLFQKFPPLLFELLKHPPNNAQNYLFDSVTLKEPGFEIDGVFLPPEDETKGIVYIPTCRSSKSTNIAHLLVC